VASAGWAAEGVGIWRALVTPDLLEPGPAGDAKRQAVRESFELNHGRMHGMRGAEFAYTYADSPLVEPQPDNPARWDRNVYVPVVRPGARIPHMWLKDGTPLQDALGCGFTLLDLSGGFDAGPIVEAFRSLGSPLDVVSRDERRVRDTFGRSVFLLRPDLHIVWSGDGPIPDPASLARRSLGHPLR
jgi:hypothetical protein